MASPLKAKRKVIYTKVEATYGTDAAPVAGTDAIVAHNVSLTPIELAYEERDPAMPFFGNQGLVKAGEMTRMEYDVEIAGAGAVDSVARYGPCLRGCAFSQTITATTGPVTYAPITTGEESVTKWFFWDQVKHVMLGARGNAEFRFSEGRRPMIHFSWVGLYGGISDAALPAPTLTGVQTPLTVTKAGLPTLTLHGFAAGLRELVINQGNAMEYHNRPNQELIHFTDRKARGSATIVLPTVTEKDFFTIIRNGTLGAIALVHGTTAGNKALIDAANVQITNPRYSEANGTVFVQVGLEIRPSASGNDEFTYKTQ